MSEWKEYKLGDLVSINMGQSPKSDTYNDNKLGLPFFQGNRTFGRLYPAIDTYCIAPIKVAEYNDILFSVRAPVGDINYSPEKVCIGRGLCSMRMKSGNQNFLFYLLNFIRQDIINKESGTVFGSVNKTTLENLIVTVPDLSTQTAIAEILSSLDDKIELNNKINQELEDLAQTLFKRWFIDFEFPNENGDPYKSSGGEMVDSELGEIPKGWGVRKFENIVKISTGKGVNKSNFQVDGEYPVIGANGIMGFYTNYNIEGFRILTGRVGTLGTVRISNEKAWTSDNVLICEPFYKEYNHYSFFMMKDFDFNSLNRGSTQPLITQSDLKLQTILLPQKNILTLFQNQMDYCLSMLENNYSENKNLIKIRDTLLPKLISGELELSQIQNIP